VYIKQENKMWWVKADFLGAPLRQPEQSAKEGGFGR